VRGELVGLEEGDILDKQANQPLTVAVGCAGIPPEPRHVGGQRQDLGLLRRCDSSSPEWSAAWWRS